MQTNRLKSSWYITSLLLAVLFISQLPPIPSIACTIALIKGEATVAGRPLLMKTRDCQFFDQEFIYDERGLYAYIGVTDADVTNQVFGGINETGFAIINSNAYNFEDTVAGPADDGYIMKLALETCVTVTDFQSILDSTNITGRTLPAVYGVMDAFGGGIFYEASAGSYFIHDWNDSTSAPAGYMVRCTFAYSGGPQHNSQFRHDRALALIDSAYAEGMLNRQYLAQTVFRDLYNSGDDPYPLPYQGHIGSLPYGYINTYIEDIINRAITYSTLIIEGINPGDDPGLTTLWAMAGQPITTVALPLWVAAGSVPVEFDGPAADLSTLNARSGDFREYLYHLRPSLDYLDTWRLIDQWGEGMLPFLLDLEDRIAIRGDSARAIWEDSGLPASGDIAAFQNELAADALAELQAWGPPQPPQITLTILPAAQIQLTWPMVAFNIFGQPLEVASYTIYGSDQPFLNRLAGDSLTTVISPEVTLPLSDSCRFFQVRCNE